MLNWQRDPDPWSPEIPEGHFPCQCPEPEKIRHAGLIACPYTRAGERALGCDGCYGCRHCRGLEDEKEAKSYDGGKSRKPGP